jgi:ppGpp synthetase/RelA/SpoT-type nucleotidyltranferase
MHGYSAVHVIASPEGAPIEIQVRTALQHEWAELFEKLADLVGRGIRYGEPPRAWPKEMPIGGVAPVMLESYAEVCDDAITAARMLAELISRMERREMVDPADADVRRAQVKDLLSEGHLVMGSLEDFIRQL